MLRLGRMPLAAPSAYACATPSRPVEPEPSSSAPLLTLCPSACGRGETDVIEVRAHHDELVLQHRIAAFQNADHVLRVPLRGVHAEVNA